MTTGTTTAPPLHQPGQTWVYSAAVFVPASPAHPPQCCCGVTLELCGMAVAPCRGVPPALGGKREIWVSPSAAVAPAAGQGG